jgi:biopolymer transport protein ExbD
MAEITSSERIPHRRHRIALRPVRMDMTPMVDLAFLLLTFFILTTSLRRLEGMDLVAPLGVGRKAPENTLTFLVGGRDTIFGFAGGFDPKTTVPKRYGLDQVRYALGSVKDTAALALFIKPRFNTRYADVLGLVDAFNLTGLRYYAVQDSVPEREWMAALAGRHEP